MIEKDVYDKSLLIKFDNKFNLIFLDPPYKDENFIKILISIQEFNLLDKDGIIILHRHIKEKGKFPENFKIIEEKKYGISKIFFLNYLNQ